MTSDKIKKYLAKQPGVQFSARWISIKLKQEQPLISRELRKLVKAGLIHCQTRTEFDTEYSRLCQVVRCRRRRNYYWV